MKRKSDGRELKHRQVAFKAKEVNDDGSFKGYASVFGNLDSYREIVAPGAFTDSIKRIKDSGDPLPVLWQHRSGEPIGGSDVLEEDNYGLKTDGWLLKDVIPRAAEAHALMKRRVVRGLSIGYYVEADTYNEKEGIRTLLKLDLVEYSIVTFPANSLAMVDDVKAAQLKTIREFESFLRDVGGFSSQRAKQIAAAGWCAVDEARDGHDEALAKALEALASFKLN
jgi:HK97 family phage prohead protease